MFLTFFIACRWADWLSCKQQKSAKKETENVLHTIIDSKSPWHTPNRPRVKHKISQKLTKYERARKKINNREFWRLFNILNLHYVLQLHVISNHFYFQFSASFSSRSTQLLYFQFLLLFHVQLDILFYFFRFSLFYSRAQHKSTVKAFCCLLFIFFFTFCSFLHQRAKHNILSMCILRTNWYRWKNSFPSKPEYIARLWIFQ